MEAREAGKARPDQVLRSTLSEPNVAKLASPLRSAGCELLVDLRAAYSDMSKEAIVSPNDTT